MNTSSQIKHLFSLCNLKTTLDCEIQSTSQLEDDPIQVKTKKKQRLRLLRDHTNDLNLGLQTSLLLAVHSHICRRLTFSAACQGRAKHRSEDIYLHLRQYGNTFDEQ